MKKLEFILSLILVAFLATSCGSADDAEEYGTKFHDFFKARDYENMVSMISEKGLEASSKEDWIAMFKNVNEKIGDLTSYKKTGFHTKINHGLTTVILNYDIEFGNKIFYAKLYFIKKGNGYKIQKYEFNKDKSKLGDQ